MKKGKKEVGLKQIILIGVLILMGIGYYFYLSNRTVNRPESTAAISATQEALMRNLEMDYPPSPKEVVKYYAQLTKCFYTPSNTMVETEQLASKSRELFDEKLVATQTDEEYLSELLMEIEKFKTQNISISSYSPSSSVDVKFYTKDGSDWASLYCTFSIRSGTTRSTIRQQFLLRKDAVGHWKIYGWEKVEESDAE